MANDMFSDTATQLEALLFALGRPLTHTEVQKMLGVSATDVAAAVAELQGRGGGITLVDDGRELELRTAGSAAPMIESVRKEEYSREIGRAGLEVLSAVIYRGPLSRSEIDFIRGVNSSQTLRTLTLRGLLRRIPNPKDERSFLYEPTVELLAELGVARVQDLPEYAEVKAKLMALEEAYKQKQTE